VGQQVVVRQEEDTPASECRERGARQCLTLPTHVPGVRLRPARSDPEQRGLAGTVAAEERTKLTRNGAERGRRKDLPPTVRLADAVGAEKLRHASALPRSAMASSPSSAGSA
jgi:hypothetical protein